MTDNKELNSPGYEIPEDLQHAVSITRSIGYITGGAAGRSGR